MRYLKKYEGVVKAADLKRVKIEGDALNIILKCLDKYGIKGMSEFKKKCDETLGEIEDIWSEIPFEFDDVDVTFEPYLYHEMYKGRKSDGE